MAKIANDRFDIHCDDRFILDDEDVGVSLALDLGERFGHQRFDVVGRGVDQIGGILVRESFEAGQQQRLARQGRDPGESCMGDALGAVDRHRRFFALVDIGAGPDRVKGAVQAEPRIDVARKFFGLGNDCFKRRTDEIVAVDLASGQRAGVAAQERQVGGEVLSKRHKRTISMKCFARCGRPVNIMQPCESATAVHDWRETVVTN